MGRAVLILLDTHVVAWVAFEPNRISKSARAAIDEARAAAKGRAVSDISLFELARVAAKKRLDLAASPKSFLSEVEQRFVVIPITAEIGLRSLSLPRPYPRDPADRIIAATAIVEGLRLITADRGIRNSRALATVW